MLKYYFYLSKSKIDDLYAQTAAGNIEQKEIQEKMEMDISAGTSKDKLSVLSLIGADIKLGANGVVQFNKIEKASYPEKLCEVLTCLEKENQIEFLNMSSSEPKLNALYYAITDKFHVSDTSHATFKDDGITGGIVSIDSDIDPNSGIKLSLACSMKYFSDENGKGELILRSDSIHFFCSLIKIRFSTVFLFTGFDKEKKIIYGSPLFLSYSREPGFREIRFTNKNKN